MNTATQGDQTAPSGGETTPVLHHEIVIVGGGTGGITVAAQLRKNHSDIAIIEPSDKHYYQPAWTLVGGGTFELEDTIRSEADYIPQGTTWIRDAVDSFDPDKNRLKTRQGTLIEYDILIVAAGIQINWDGIKGLKESIGKDGVCSNYSIETVSSTWETLRNFKGGNAIFTQPKGAIKCGGAPQKICYLAEDYLRKHGLRDESHVIFAAPGKAIFSIQKYREILEKVVALGFGYRPPRFVHAFQAELRLDQDHIRRHLGNNIYVFGLGLSDIRFVGLTPKKEHVTISVIGTDDANFFYTEWTLNF